MPPLILEILPLALGAAVSPTVLMIELLILSGANRPKARAWAFVAGLTVILIAVVVLFLTLLSRTSAGANGPSVPVRIVDGAAALLLLVVGIRNLLPSKTQGEKQKSKVASRLETAPLPFYAGVGVVTMLTNASTLILLAPACHDIARSDATTSVKTAATVVLVVIVMLPFVLPVTAVTVLGHRADGVLGYMNRFVSGHSRQLNAGICFVLAALLAWKAFH